MFPTSRNNRNVSKIQLKIFRTFDHVSRIIVVNAQFKRQCKGQTYKRAKIILLCHQVMCLFRTEPFTCVLIAKIHSLSCYYKYDYY